MAAKRAIIIGAGPAGLTAAFELLEKTDVVPLVFEMSGDFGGIAKTINYKGNRIDIGGHRFFSKSDRVMEWWSEIMPLEGTRDGQASKMEITYQNKRRAVDRSGSGPDPDKTDNVMLVRGRLSRIFYLRKFFDYPVTLNAGTLKNLGPVRITKIMFSYLRARLLPIKPEKSLEDFFINRFGRELYLTFFRDYTEKVWGVPCADITAEWGAQRIKGLSISKAVAHAAKSIFGKRDQSVGQKGTETSLIEQFLYPKLGPGQMWEEVAKIVSQKGGQITTHRQAVKLKVEGQKIKSVVFSDTDSGAIEEVAGDYFFSTMPIKELVADLDTKVPADAKRIAEGLMYRDFITVGLLMKKLKIKNETAVKTPHDIVPDNWIYIQEPEVKVGRLQIFNNWSPYLVRDPDTVWIGLEYFCNQGDELWRKPDAEMKQFAIDELERIDIIDAADVLDSTVIHMPKTYPAYFGTYEEFPQLRRYLDSFENLFLVGRNGMHRYNNQDHSMLTAMTAVENIKQGIKTKDNIWEVNTEMEYHESK